MLMVQYVILVIFSPQGYRFWGLTRGRSVRKTSARTNRLSLARSLDDLEVCFFFKKHAAVLMIPGSLLF